MSPRDALVIAVFVLMLVGVLALGAYVATRPRSPRRFGDGDDGLDAHFDTYRRWF